MGPGGNGSGLTPKITNTGPTDPDPSINRVLKVNPDAETRPIYKTIEFD